MKTKLKLKKTWRRQTHQLKHGRGNKVWYMQKRSAEHVTTTQNTTHVIRVAGQKTSPGEDGEVDRVLQKKSRNVSNSGTSFQDRLCTVISVYAMFDSYPRIISNRLWIISDRNTCGCASALNKYPFVRLLALYCMSITQTNTIKHSIFKSPSTSTATNSSLQMHVLCPCSKDLLMLVISSMTVGRELATQEKKINTTNELVGFILNSPCFCASWILTQYHVVYLGSWTGNQKASYGGHKHSNSYRHGLRARKPFCKKASFHRN